MNIVILGAGRVGFHLAKQLIHEDKQVTLIERDPEKAKHASNQLDCIVINEEGNSIETLKLADTDNADFFISVTESDEINMLACGLVAGEFKKPVTIARVRNFDYSKSRIAENPLFGIDHIINPEIEAAKVIARAVEHGAMSNVMLFETSSVQMRNVQIDQPSPFTNTNLQDIRSSINVDFLAPLILREGEYIIPSGNTTVMMGDELYILSTEKGFETIFSLLGKPKTDLKKVAIIGGGSVGCYVADYILNGRISTDNLFKKIIRKIARLRTKPIHFIEKDYERCKFLIERYPDAMVTHADISDEGFLEEGDLQNYDLLISTTGNQELNIITSMFAKKQGISRVIALVHKIAYKSMTQELGIDVGVSMNDTTVNTILKTIRKGNIRSIHTIASSKFEIIEFSVDGSSAIRNQSIKKIKLPKDSLIVLVMRDGENIIPYGDLEIKSGDHVVFVSKQESIKKIEAIITGL